MRAFFLQPNNNDTTHPGWEATSLHEGCWVLAESEDHARRLVELGTMKVVDFVPGRGKLHSPWLDRGLSTCIEGEPPFDLVEGTIKSVSGKECS